MKPGDDSEGFLQCLAQQGAQRAIVKIITICMKGVFFISSIIISIRMGLHLSCVSF